MSTNFPTALDDATSLGGTAADNTTYVDAADHNNQSDAIIATQTKLGTGADTPVAGDVLYGTDTGKSGWGVLGTTAFLASGVYALGRKQNSTQVLRIEYKSGSATSRSDGANWTTAVTWDNAFSTILAVFCTSEKASNTGSNVSQCIVASSTTGATGSFSRGGIAGSAVNHTDHFLAIGY